MFDENQNGGVSYQKGWDHWFTRDGGFTITVVVPRKEVHGLTPCAFPLSRYALPSPVFVTVFPSSQPALQFCMNVSGETPVITIANDKGSLTKAKEGWRRMQEAERPQVSSSPLCMGPLSAVSA
jgi:hypothetical protein